MVTTHPDRRHGVSQEYEQRCACLVVILVGWAWDRVGCRAALQQRWQSPSVSFYNSSHRSRRRLGQLLQNQRRHSHRTADSTSGITLWCGQNGHGEIFTADELKRLLFKDHVELYGSEGYWWCVFFVFEINSVSIMLQSAICPRWTTALSLGYPPSLHWNYIQYSSG